MTLSEGGALRELPFLFRPARFFREPMALFRGCPSTPLRRHVTCSATGNSSGPPEISRRSLNQHSAQVSVPQASLAMLQNISVVLARIQGPINLGSSARCMQNFAFSDLRLVAPDHEQVCSTCPPDNSPVFAQQTFDHATSASWILDGVQRVSPDVPSAIDDSTMVVATSARAKNPTFEHSSVREAAPQMLEHAAAGGKVALLFGNERTGLTNDEIALAHRSVCIPAAGIASVDSAGEGGRASAAGQRPKRGLYTGGGPGSLNLSHAVSVVLYELFQQAVSDDRYVQQALPDKATDKSRLLNTGAREQLRTDLLEALKATSVVDGEHWNRVPDSETGFKEAHERRWSECLSRLLSAGPFDEGDAGVLFRLARRVTALGKQAASGTWLGERQPMLLSALVASIKRAVEAGALDAQPSDEAVRRYLRDSVGVSLEKRELSVVASTIRSTEHTHP